MTVIETARFLLKKYTSGGDPHPTRAEHNAMIDTIENNAAMHSQGITDARPAAGKSGRFFFDVTTGIKRLWYDDGSNWNDLNPNGGGGAAAKVTPGVNGTEGVSARSARADHTHRLDLATSAAAGAMSATDKALLDTATAAATANALARRDANGRISVNSPTDPAHAVTKSYADGQLVQAADYADAAVQAGPAPTSLAPGSATGYTIGGTVHTENAGAYLRVTVDITVMRSGGAVNVPGGSTTDFMDIGTLIPVGARGAGHAKYLPVALSGGATNAHATVYLGPDSGLLRIKAPAAFTWNNGALFSVTHSYLVVKP